MPAGPKEPTFGSVAHGIDKGRLAENILTLPKSTTTAVAPLHAMFRHTMSLAASHPISWVKGAKAGAITFADFLKNPGKADATVSVLNDKMRRSLDSNGWGNVEIRNPHGGAVSGEDFTPSQLPGKIPVFGRAFLGGQAGFSMVQNVARYEAAKGMTSQYARLLGRPLTEAERAGMADTLNHFTGRGFRTETPAAQSARAASNAGRPLTLAEKSSLIGSNDKYATARIVGRFANVPFFSPQLQSSYARMVGDTIKAAGNLARNPRDPVALETMRLAGGTIAGIAGFVMLARMAGLGVDTDTTSSNFMKIDLGPKNAATGVLSAIGSQFGVGTTSESDGHVYLDPTHSMASYIKTVAQTVRNVQEGGRGARGDVNIGDPLGSLIANRLSPGFYELNQYRLGHPADLLSIVLPMWAEEGAQGAGWEPPTVQVGKTPKPAPGTTPTPSHTPRPDATPARTAAPKSSPRVTPRPTR